MSEPSSFNPELPKHWTPTAQEKFLTAMASGTRPRAWYCKSPGRRCDGAPHGPYDYRHARGDQWPPPMEDETWKVFLLAGGRGSGKTRAGAELLRHMTRYTSRLALVAPTAADLRDTMIEGESGVMRVCENAGYLVSWEPSKRRLTFPNGAIAIGYTAEEADRLRGRNDGFAWVDEAAHYPNVEYVWDMLMFGLRMETTPRVCVTTTPTPSAWLRGLIEEPSTRVSKVSTFANEANLAPAFIATMHEKYGGTRLGRQELYAEVLQDTEGALWSGELLDATRAPVAPHLARVAVGVDPAGTSAARSDETGIVVVGLGLDGHLYVLGDYSGRYTPGEWALNVFAAVSDFDADVVVAETNYGGDMVRTVLDTTERPPKAAGVRIKMVSSRKGKLIRAEPVFALFEQARAHLVGAHGVLESQLCFPAGTLVATDRGEVPIEKVTTRDRVLTRNGGYAPLQYAGPTGVSGEFVEVTHDQGDALTCTPWHKIWTETRGFVPARSVEPGDVLDVRRGFAPTRSRTAGTGTTPSTRTPPTTGEGPEAACGCSTAPSGKTTTDGRSRTDTSSTTATTTRATTSRATSSWSPTPSMPCCTNARGTSATTSWTPPSTRPERTSSGPSGAPTRASTPASPVALDSGPRACEPCSARSSAVVATTARSAVTEVVYDLTVAEGYAPEFYADGVLVHNCSWVPGTGKSPDRLDALVHAAIELSNPGGTILATPTGHIARNRTPRPGKGNLRDLKAMMRGALHGR